MFLGHSGLEVGRGHVIGTALVLSPLHKQAIGQASIHAEDEHGFRILYAATVVVVGNIESLMEPALDAPALPIELQPLLGVEPLGRRTGDQRHLFVLATLGLTQQSSGLSCEGESHVFGTDLSGADGPVLRTPLVLFPSASLS